MQVEVQGHFALCRLGVEGVSGPRCILVTMWNGSIASVTVPYLRTMSMAEFNEVPASSMNVSARVVNSSNSFDAIQTKRGESS